MRIIIAALILLTFLILIMLVVPAVDSHNIKEKIVDETRQASIVDNARQITEEKPYITIEEAYRAIPHGRTKFDISRARMSTEEAEYLDHLFFVTDMALRERVVMLSHFFKGKDQLYIKRYNKEVGNLLASFELTKPPTKALKQVELLIKESIEEQQSFYKEWHKARGTSRYKSISSNYTSHHLVQSSHAKLLQAYMVLKQNYGSETKHNQKAFFDHLCALDFI